MVLSAAAAAAMAAAWLVLSLSYFCASSCLASDEMRSQLCRPDFEATFKQLGQAHPGTQIGVFYCGVQMACACWKLAVTK